MDIMQKYKENKISLKNESSDTSLPFRKRLWKAWLIVSHKIGVFNSRVILTLFYFLIIMPYSILMMPFVDFMRIKSKQTWIKRQTYDLTIDDAKRQS